MKDAPGRLEFFPQFAREEALRGLEGFSHIWLIFLFHDNMGREKNGDIGNKRSWSPMVRPPRLGGNKKVGVFASRSPFRPNPIGMSVVRLETIDMTAKGPVLNLSGVDMLDNTPILDIKPYLPYSDVIPGATDGFAKGKPKTLLKVGFSERAMAEIRARQSGEPNLLSIITGVLENDPRPAYKAEGNSDDEGERIFGIRLFDFDLKWRIRDGQITVIDLEPV